MNINDFKRKKQQHEKITMLTCYDYPSARMMADTPIDCALVGDSVAMAVHGHKSTVMATMDMLVLHTESVARGLGSQFLISDLAFLTYHNDPMQSIEHVKRLMQAGAQAVKIEGGNELILKTVSHFHQAQIPVMGHIGLTPQSVSQLGGYRVQGKNEIDATRLIAEAEALEQAGCFAVVLECIPAPLAQTITQRLSIPTIGIGAGSATDGQVLVWHDMLGLQDEFKPRFVKHYLNSKDQMQAAIRAYANDVHHGLFPNDEHAY